jgi:hypothetical protein
MTIFSFDSESSFKVSMAFDEEHDFDDDFNDDIYPWQSVTLTTADDDDETKISPEIVVVNPDLDYIQDCLAVYLKV